MTHAIDGRTDAPVPAPPLISLGDRIGLFLDLDGVLAAIEPHPDKVVPTVERTALLTKLMHRLEGRLAIISGRTISEIDRICAGAVPTVAGIHGLEMRTAGRMESVSIVQMPAQVMEVARAFAAAHPQIYLEDKGVAVAIHYRDAPELRGEVQTLANRMGRKLGLAVQSGHCVEEVRLAGPDKGDALIEIMEQPAFKDCTPVMLGDDLTDEAGFAAAMSRAGFGIRVKPHGLTCAQYGLADVDQVFVWLSAYVESGGRA